MTVQLNRRSLLKSLLYLAGGAATCAQAASALADELHAPLRARREGELDIHHIDTGRGNCALILAPDGTSLMIDAGTSNAPQSTSGKPRPDASRRTGEWQARYALAHANSATLDYFLATHIHPDHIGDVDTQTTPTPDAPFRLTGVSDVDLLIPITTVIDRAYPDYGATPPLNAPFAANYLAYLKHRVDTKRTVARAEIGSDQQIRLLHSPDRYPSFKARILSANGEVWTGEGRETLRAIPADAHPDENALSVATRIQYGRFSYFSGGDLASDTHDGREPWRDIESPVARAAGRTEVACANHHGYFDACGPEFVRALDAQAYIIQSWDIGHPGSAQMQRLLGAWSSKATHDVFATGLLPANELMNRRFTPQLKSKQGHVIIRVAPGGDTYTIYTADSTQETGNITGVFGPYQSRT